MIGKAPLPDTQTYTDLTQLQSLKAKSQRDNPEALKAAVRQFESIFVSMMLKSMRAANAGFAEGNMLNSEQTQFYQDMFDSQLSVDLAQNRGLGLTEVLMRQLGGGLMSAPADAEPKTPVVERTLKNYERDLYRPVIAKDAQESLQQVGTLVDRLEATRDLYQDQPSMKAAASGIEARPLDPISFETPEQFVAHLYPIAKDVADELGVDPKVLVAQAALETGWGSHVIPRGAGSSFNLFGIKADSRWSGDSAQVSTLEYRDGVPLREKAHFRAYDSYADSFRDYLDFLRSNPRYQEALAQRNDSEAFVSELQQAGYATDPRYSDKITRIMRGDRLQAAVNKVGG